MYLHVMSRFTILFLFSIQQYAQGLIGPVPLASANVRRVRMYAEKTPEQMLEEAAKLRAEVNEVTPAAAPISAEDAKAKITAALKRATQSRDKEELRIALSAAEEAGFSGSDPLIQKAVIAYNQVSELSDTMRKRLVSEARAQGGDPSINWNPGTAYIGIFALVAVLVVLGGKGIFY